jgi:hypothetical protein
MALRADGAHYDICAPGFLPMIDPADVDLQLAASARDLRAYRFAQNADLSLTPPQPAQLIRPFLTFYAACADIFSRTEVPEYRYVELSPPRLMLIVRA